MNLEHIEETVEWLRSFERGIAALFISGSIKSPVHFASGNESQLIRLFRGLRPGEYVFHTDPYNRDERVLDGKFEIPSGLPENHPVFRGIKPQDHLYLSYRCHYHSLLKGVPKEHLQEEIVKGRSMFFMNSLYNIVTTAIVPGQVSIALGAAMGVKLKGIDSHIWAFCGDMAAETGIFHECTKYARGHALPITFVVEDNSLSVDTPTTVVWGGTSPITGNNIIKYSYKSGVPHQGVGKEVGF